MKKLLFTLSLILAVYNVSSAQCTAWWMGWSTPNYTATFVDSSGTDPNVTTYLWDFGDGNTSAAQNPTNQYATGGWYYVCFTLVTQVNGQSCTATQCDSLYVGTMPSTCNALFTASNTPNSNFIYYFNNQSQTTGGYATYVWSFGDGTSSTNPSPSHTYSAAGTYSVCLTVNVNSNTGNISCTSTFCDTITVAGTPPPVCTAIFGHQTTGLTANFNAGGGNYIYSWNFGDGSIGTSQYTSHTYNSAGTYIVCLTVENFAGTCMDSICTSVTVTGGSTTGNCDATFTYQNTPVGTYFNAGSNASNYYYDWSFGDSSYSYQANPVHAYAVLDSYYVCLTVTDSANNCSDTYCAYVLGGSNNNTNSNFDLQGLAFSDSSSGNWSEALIYLIQFDSLTQTLSVVDTQTTQYGYFNFRNVVAGNYLLKAALLPSAPAYNDFLPTYYQSVLFWYDAATISVPTGPNTFYSIYMIPGINPGGPGFIGGNVNQGANKQGGDPLSDIQVMLLNMDDSPVSYTYSTSTGAFSFDNLPYGTYKVYAEVIGKPTYPNIVTISASKESVSDVAVVVEEDGVYSSVKEVDATFVDGTNFFPNPVAGIGKLSFNAKEAGDVTVRVLNMLGEVVLEQQTQVLSGTQSIMVDMNNQQAGAYILSISFNNNTAAHTRFIRE